MSFGGETSGVDKVRNLLNYKRFPNNNLGEVQWYKGCTVERERTAGMVCINQTAFIDILLKRFDDTIFLISPRQFQQTLHQSKRDTRWWRDHTRVQSRGEGACVCDTSST